MKNQQYDSYYIPIVTKLTADICADVGTPVVVPAKCTHPAPVKTGREVS